jgi:hypothetical protein
MVEFLGPMNRDRLKRILDEQGFNPSPLCQPSVGRICSRNVELTASEESTCSEFDQPGTRSRGTCQGAVAEVFRGVWSSLAWSTVTTKARTVSHQTLTDRAEPPCLTGTPMPTDGSDGRLSRP